jgi:hypothetical protein
MKQNDQQCRRAKEVKGKLRVKAGYSLCCWRREKKERGRKEEKEEMWVVFILWDQATAKQISGILSIANCS